MSAFTLTQIQPDYYAVMHGGRRVAILMPTRPVVAWLGIPLSPAEPWSIVPDPEAFPDAECVGLPWPLRAAGHEFDTFEEARAFVLDIPADAREAVAA